MALIPTEMLHMMVTEAAAQFDQTVVWLQQVFDSSGNATTNSYGEKSFHAPKFIQARAVTVWNESFTNQGFQRVESTQWYLPPNTGVRAGDRIYGYGDDPDRYPPIESVKQVPDPVTSIFEVVMTGTK